MKNILLIILLVPAALFVCCTSKEKSNGSQDVNTTPSNSQYNFLIFIADDLGVDASSAYGFSTDVPSTPNLVELQKDGLVFENFWATPACTTTRGALISGKHGYSSDITYVPAVMPADTVSLQNILKSSFLPEIYNNGMFGKWHLGGSNPAPNHPNQFGVDHYFGNLFNLDDYFSWIATENGSESLEDEYHTSAISNAALKWIKEQPAENPWLAWVAFSAPHVPFHNPPEELVTTHANGATDQEKYKAMVEAMDTSIGKIMEGMSPEQREKTIVIFLGDNGTPTRVLNEQVFDKTRGKKTIYEGGIRTPLIIGGTPVTSKNTRVSSLVNITDFYATLLQIANLDSDPPASAVDRYQSYDFSDLLISAFKPKPRRAYNYAEFEDAGALSWAVRNDTYKYIYHQSGQEELFNVISDIKESNDLASLPANAAVLSELRTHGQILRSGQSGTSENIENSVFTNRSNDCGEYIGSFSAEVFDVFNATGFEALFSITADTGYCYLQGNSLPNHDFNNGSSSFAHLTKSLNESFRIPRHPSENSVNTKLTLQYDNAVMLNGVKLDLLAAACYGVGGAPLGQEKTGCNDADTPWRYDPVFAGNTFKTDLHNAHTQPDGAYHYHGDPNALYDLTGQQESGVIGFAADGFPIFGPYINDGGTVRLVTSGYTLKSGIRESISGEGALPPGSYDGTFRDDYEYTSAGDLDECNGMTENGVYGYYLTNEFPWILNCYKGSLDPSFSK